MKKIILMFIIIIFEIFILNKNVLSNSLNISKKDNENKISEFFSNKKKFSAISIFENRKINIYKKNLQKNENYEVVNNEDKYKKILSVDDYGNVLYSSISSNPHYPDQGIVYFNNKKLNVNPGTHSSAINYEDLFVWKFFHYHSEENRFWLYIYNSDKEKIKYFIFKKKFPKKIFFLDKKNIYVETFDGKKIESHILNLNSLVLKPSKKIQRKSTSYKKYIFSNKLTSSEQDILIRYLNVELNNDPLGILSNFDNYEGRISWYVSKKLEALINIYTLHVNNFILLNNNYNLKQVINRYVENILKNYKEIGWPTTKYSLDKNKEINLSVNNSTIFYPLLKFVNSGLKNDLKKEKILRLFEDFFERHESNYSEEKNLYLISDSNYQYEGIEPLNWQSLFGLCLIEAYKATKNQKYLARLRTLSHMIKNQIYVLDDGSLIWPYSYLEDTNLLLKFGAGEDLSHAAVNVNFLIESSLLLGQNFYSESLIDSLNQTLENHINLKDLNFKKKLNGNIKSYKYLPSEYWLKIDNKKLNFIHSQNLIEKDNYFNNSRLLSYTIMLNNSFK